LLTVLPDVSAAEHVKTKALHRVPFAALPRIEVFASYPASIDRRGSVTALVDAVRARIQAPVSQRATMRR
jgi:hypothetical protein